MTEEKDIRPKQTDTTPGAKQPRLFAFAPSIRSKATKVCTQELFRQQYGSPETQATCQSLAQIKQRRDQGLMTDAEYQEAKRKLKGTLGVMMFNANFSDNHRCIASAIPSGLCMTDYDHIPHPEELWQEAQRRLEAQGLMPYIALAHITPSTEGLRIVFVSPEGMSLSQAQEWLGQAIGRTDHDPQCKDLSRPSYIVPTSYILHLNPDTLFYVSDPPQAVKAQLAPTPSSPPTAQPAPPLRTSTNIITYEADYDGIPYSLIVEQLTQVMNGPPCHGWRNKFIFDLSCHLRNICDNDPEWLKLVVPTFGEDRTKASKTIESACNRRLPEQLPRALRQAIKRAKAVIAQADGSAATDGDTDGPSTDKQAGKTIFELTGTALDKGMPPRMPRKLPELIKLLTGKVPTDYRAAVSQAVFPALAAHLHRVVFSYIDNSLHEATLMSLLMANSSAGKSSINAPIDHIMADIRERDAVNMERERQWREECSTISNNKDRPRRPADLIIQELDPDCTNPAFVLRTKDADGRFLYSRMNELNMFDALKGNGKLNSQFNIMCLAFDFDNIYGQTRVSPQSVTDRVKIRYNWNASTTIDEGRRYFRNVLTNGPLHRISLCTIPPRDIGSPMPVYGIYDDAFDQALKPYIDHLNAARGHLHCPEALELARKLRNELADKARLSQNKIFEEFSFRANLIGYLKACVLYVANGCKWEKEIEKFVGWSVDYDLWCKMEFFSDLIEQSRQSGYKMGTARGARNMLWDFPTTFTKAEAERIRMEHNLDRKGTASMLRKWASRKYIKKDAQSESYTKLKFIS